MESNLSNKKNEKVNTLVDDAKDASNKGNDTQIQLSNNLITITLAFVALLATAISTSSVLPTISIGQKILIMASIVVFCVSIFVGLVNFYLNMRHQQRAAKKSRDKARRADDAKSAAGVDGVERAVPAGDESAAVRRSNALIVTQVALLAIGLVLCVAFIGTMLFGTSEEI